MNKSNELSTEESEFLPMEKDPLYKPTKKKAVPIMQPAITKVKPPLRRTSRIRPIIGLVSSPYLLVRPFVKFLSVKGNELFDKVYHPEG